MKEFITANWIEIGIVTVMLVDKIAQNADPENKYTWNEHVRSVTRGISSILRLRKK